MRSCSAARHLISGNRSGRFTTAAIRSPTGSTCCPLERDLVDELNLRIFPVVLGAGLRLFPEQGQTHHLELLDTITVPSGVTMQMYRPAGRATFGDGGD
jgi:hypothetical protein